MEEYTLKDFTEEELMVVAKSIPIQVLLGPIKKNDKKQYSAYMSRLGRLDGRNKTLKENLPAVAVHLFKKGDLNYVRFFEKEAEDIKNDLIPSLTELLETENISAEVLQKYTREEYFHAIDIYIDLLGAEKFDLCLFLLQLKLNGVFPEEEIIKAIKDKYSPKEEKAEEQPAEEPSKEPEEEIAEDSVKAPSPKQKKKKTAQEKEALRLATEKKKKEEKKAAKQAIKEEMEKHNNAVNEKSILFKPGEDTVATDNKPGERTFAGIINIRKSFYNFAPVAELLDGTFIPLTEIERDKLFSASLTGEINLYYNVWDEFHVNRMKEIYVDGKVMLFTFNPDLLEDNIIDGERNMTGYKMPGIESFKTGKLRFLSDDGYYSLKGESALIGDIEKQENIEVMYERVVDGEKILVNQKDGFYAGPFNVFYSPTRGSYIFKINRKENKYLLPGYAQSNCRREIIEDRLGYNISESVYYISNPAKVYKDIMTDQELIDSFKTRINKEYGETVDQQNAKDFLHSYNESILSGKEIPDEIAAGRMSRLEKIVTASDIEEDTLAQMLEIFSSTIGQDENGKLEELISNVLSKHPEILDNMQSLTIIKERIDSARQELENARAKKAAAIQDADKAGSNAEAAKVKLTKKQEEEFNEITEKLGVARDIEQLRDEVKRLKSDAEYYEKHKSNLQNGTKDLESGFLEMINGYSGRLADIAFDGFMSEKMMEAAAGWRQKEQKHVLENTINKVNSVSTEEFTQDGLISYLVSTIQKARPQYDKNTIINILVCSLQGFLTVFSGTPGCGKTSICNILAKTLGLKKFSSILEGETEMNPDRYIQVSVERGWTSKRDFIGYFNPLTKEFEESNREVFDGMRILDKEMKNKLCRFPFLILLDEANLSQMEYYWADFMNLCDDRDVNHTINLGNSRVFDVPDTLHFVATINNDHTIETLSPRLIDRAWVITLPRNNGTFGGQVPEEDIKIVPWDILKSTFIAPEDPNLPMDNETKQIFEEIKKKMQEMNLFISPRVDIAIRRYCSTASKLMEDDKENTADVIALDYAIAQKVLPTIMGNGDDYETWLSELKDICTESGLVKSSRILSDIMRRGSMNMKYYQFF